MIAPNGAWAGWSLATAKVSDQFIAASLGVSSTACDGAVTYGKLCGTIPGWADTKLGKSYQTSWDYYAYLNSMGGSGLVEFAAAGGVRDYEQWLSITCSTRTISPPFRNRCRSPCSASAWRASQWRDAAARLERSFPAAQASDQSRSPVFSMCVR